MKYGILYAGAMTAMAAAAILASLDPKDAAVVAGRAITAPDGHAYLAKIEETAPAGCMDVAFAPIEPGKSSLRGTVCPGVAP